MTSYRTSISEQADVLPKETKHDATKGKHGRLWRAGILHDLSRQKESSELCRHGCVSSGLTVLCCRGIQLCHDLEL